MDQVWVVEKVVQEPDAWDESCPSVVLRLNLQVLDFEKVPRHCSLDEDGTGKGVYNPRIHPQQVGCCLSRPDLPIGRVPRLNRYLFHRVRLDDRGTIRVPSIVPSARLVFEWFRAVYFDGLGHRCSSVTT
jgi:hypothetical protein